MIKSHIFRRAVPLERNIVVTLLIRKRCRTPYCSSFPADEWVIIVVFSPDEKPLYSSLLMRNVGHPSIVSLLMRSVGHC